MGESDAAAARLSHRILSGEGDEVVLMLGGELDMATTEELRAATRDLIGSVSTTLVVDVEQLSFADSSAVALWVAWSQAVPRLEIRNPRPMIRRVIETMGLTAVLNPT